MRNRCQATPEDAASLAAQILKAHLTGGETPRGAVRVDAGSDPGSTLEAEKMEVLIGALESLESTRPERVDAARQLLEHLAKGQVLRPKR